MAVRTAVLAQPLLKRIAHNNLVIRSISLGWSALGNLFIGYDQKGVTGFYVMQEQDLRDEYFDRQQALFDRAKSELVREHLGEFVAFEDSEILDHDFNEIELLQRIYAKYGYRDLLIKQIWEIEPVLSVNSISHGGIGRKN